MRGHTRLIASVLATLIAMGGSLLGGLASSANASGGYTSWTMRSEPMEFVGSGETWRHTPYDSIISATGDGEVVTAGVDTYDRRLWTADFAAPLGSELEVGRTYAAEYTPQRTAETALLYLHGNGNGCDGGFGEFTVDELALDEAGQVARFAARFEQHCDGDEPALIGSIARQASEPAAPLPPAAAEPVMDLTVEAALDAAVVEWSNPLPDRFVTVEVRMARGQVPPATIEDGKGVYSGRGEDFFLRELSQGRDYALSVFTTGPDGSVAGPITAQLRGTVATFTKRHRPGRGKWLNIRLTDLQGNGVNDVYVRLDQRRPNSAMWRPQSGWFTNEDGFDRKDWVNYRTRYYRAVFEGEAQYLGYVTSELRVAKEPRAFKTR